MGCCSYSLKDKVRIVKIKIWMSVSYQSHKAKSLEPSILLAMPDCLFSLLPVGSFTHLIPCLPMNHSLASHRVSQLAKSGGWP